VPAPAIFPSTRQAFLRSTTPFVPRGCARLRDECHDPPESRFFSEQNFPQRHGWNLLFFFFPRGFVTLAEGNHQCHFFRGPWLDGRASTLVGAWVSFEPFRPNMSAFSGRPITKGGIVLFMWVGPYCRFCGSLHFFRCQCSLIEVPLCSFPQPFTNCQATRQSGVSGPFPKIARMVFSLFPYPPPPFSFPVMTRSSFI